MKLSDRDLEDLLGACADGDRQAFRALYDAVAPRLLAVARSILVRRDWAEDAVQDAFVNIWRNAGRYDRRRGAPMTWLYAIARYRALSLRERQARDGAFAAGGVLPELADGGPGPYDEAERRGAARALRLCLDELDADQRRAVQMAFVHGYSHSELAAAMERPLGTVKAWIRRGLTRLKDCLDHEAA